MKCIDFNEIYRDYLTDEESKHVESCVTCKLEWQVHCAIIEQPVESIIAEPCRVTGNENDAGTAWLIESLKKVFPSNQAIIDHLTKVLANVSATVPYARPEQIVSLLAHMKESEISKLQEADLVEELKKEHIDKDEQE